MITGVLRLRQQLIIRMFVGHMGIQMTFSFCAVCTEGAVVLRLLTTFKFMVPYEGFSIFIRSGAVAA